MKLNDSKHPRQRHNQKQQGRPQQPDELNRGSVDRDRSEADDRSRRPDRQPADTERAIPELDEPDVEGVGEEGRDDPRRQVTDNKAGG